MKTQSETNTETVRIPLRLERAKPAGSRGVEPVSFGVPLPQSRVHSALVGELVHSEGQRLSVQFSNAHYWPDGSVKWLLVDAVLRNDYPLGEWFLEIPIAGNPRRSLTPLTVSESETEIRVQTGSTEFRINRSHLHPFERACLQGNDVVEAGNSSVFLTDQKGQRFEAECEGWRVETEGPIRSTLVGEGCFPRLGGLRLRLRLNFFAETGLVKLDVTLHNPNRAKHPGGIWDLGDAGSVLFRELAITFATRGEETIEQVTFSVNDSHNGSANEVSIYQDSSGGENWNSQNHVNREGWVPCRFRGYRLSVDRQVSTGLRAEPTIAMRTARVRIALAVPRFWQQFPKSVSAGEGRIAVGLFPNEFDDLHELQGGERKTHTVWLRIDGGNSNGEELAWVHDPVAVRPIPQWCDATQTLPRLDLPRSEAVTKLESLLQESLEGQNNLFDNRERVDEYGWRNFGDIFADHEQAYYTQDQPLVSHYNNQFDMVYGFLVHFMRTGDRRYWELGDALARHVIDIDIYHTTQDRAAYNGGLFWFTDHYLHAHKSTHRTYSESNRLENGIYGGGPGAQHNFTSGLLLHFRLTGNPDSRDAVLSLADWVIAMDDGRKNVFGILDDGSTGLASGSADYQGPDRAGGNSINALLDAWLLTSSDKYLKYAEVLIQRCVHPTQDVAALDLLDVERRWSYTVFLTSLAKYLDLKLEAGQTDEMAAYAQSSLLRYADWMLENERPYFDQVEKLEYPTEAWAAQEFRKANVIRLAAEHADDPLRSRLLQRGEELANRAWQDLLRFETRTYARAIAIVMIEGLRDCGFRSFGLRSLPRMKMDQDFQGRELENFVVQRSRIHKRLRCPRGIAQIALNLCNPVRWVRFYSARVADRERANYMKYFQI